MAKTEQTPPVEFASWGDLVNRFGVNGTEAHPTLILVDESQNFSPDAGRLLRALHAQQHFPFTLVCGGLSDTRNRLRDMGISRLSSDAELRVGALAADEGREVILQTLLWTLERCAAPPVLRTVEQVEHWAAALARRALGWPQHLACCIRGAWRALAEAEPPDLGDERGLRTALQYGDEMCQRDYDGRVEASRTDPSVIAPIEEQPGHCGGLPVVDRWIVSLSATCDRAASPGRVARAWGAVSEQASASREYTSRPGAIQTRLGKNAT